MTTPSSVNPESVLTQPLLVQTQAVAVPTQMVTVVAPQNLPAGYTFQASITENSQTRLINVTVPAGGVKQGQSIIAPLPPVASTAVEVISAPRGRWKDGLCDCCSLGCFHPSLCCAWFCPSLAMGQIMTRMNLDWCGNKVTAQGAKNTFKIVAFITILFWNVSALNNAYIDYPSKIAPSPGLQLSPIVYAMTQYKELHPMLVFVNFIVSLFSVYFIIAMCKTRKAVREHYEIPEGSCGCCEDFCCTVCCGCCAVSQMARHTGEYETYKGVCCSDRGLPKNAPLNIV